MSINITTAQLKALNATAIKRGFPRHLGPDRLESVEEASHKVTAGQLFDGVPSWIRCKVMLVDGSAVGSMTLDIEVADYANLK
jgi:hypothetical protein